MEYLRSRINLCVETAKMPYFKRFLNAVKAGGLIRLYKGLVPASATRTLKDLAIAPLLPAATLIGWLFYLSLLFLFFDLPSFSGSPVNGSIYSFMLICSHICSSVNWFCMYFCIAVLFRPTVFTKYPLHQKCRFPYLYYISNLQTCRISSARFFLLIFP